MTRTWIRRWGPYLAILLASIAAAYLTGKESARVAAEKASQALYDAAVIVRESQVRGCVRSRADRMDDVMMWTRARRTRLATSLNPDVPDAERREATATVAVYDIGIAGYKSRIVDCNRAFPPVKR